MREVSLDELSELVGQEVGVSDWLLIDQDRINKFAGATGDFQWIHVDVERAHREACGPIAHGYLTVSLIPMLAQQILRVREVVRGINYGSNRVRFIAKVKVNTRVRLRQKLLEFERRACGARVVYECTIEIEGEAKPACVAEIIGVLFDR